MCKAQLAVGERQFEELQATAEREAQHAEDQMCCKGPRGWAQHRRAAWSSACALSAAPDSRLPRLLWAPQRAPPTSPTSYDVQIEVLRQELVSLSTAAGAEHCALMEAAQQAAIRAAHLEAAAAERDEVTSLAVQRHSWRPAAVRASKGCRQRFSCSWHALAPSVTLRLHTCACASHTPRPARLCLCGP